MILNSFIYLAYQISIKNWAGLLEIVVIISNLLKISITDCLQSLLPILMWFVLGIVYGDTDYFNVFTLTYPFQFVWFLINSLVVVGAIKYETKENKEDNNYAYSAIIVSFIIFLAVIVLVALNIDKISPNTKYNELYIYSLICLALDIIAVGICKVEQYNNNNKSAFNISVEYYTTRIILVAIVRLLINNKIQAIEITVMLLILYVIVLCTRKMKITHFYFNVFKGVKYQISESISSIAMFIIYFFGLQKVINGSEAFLVAYNICAMCTDTQWDILWSAIETNTSIEVCNGTYDKNVKTLIKNSVLYSLLLLLSSLIMLAISYIITQYDIKAALIILMLECSLFPYYALRYVYESYLMIEYSGIWLVIIPLIGYTIRTILSFTINSCYALSISVGVCAVYGCTAIVILYAIQRKKKLGDNR